jgi:hypothetical protein
MLDMNSIDKNPGGYIIPSMTPKDLAPDSMDMIKFFIDFFTAYTFSPKADKRDIEFNGEGAYFGKQITIREGSANRFGWNDIGEVTEVEVAYDFTSGHICIYTANNDGFWVKPFLELKDTHSEYPKLKDALHRMLSDYFGV